MRKVYLSYWDAHQKEAEKVKVLLGGRVISDRHDSKRKASSEEERMLRIKSEVLRDSQVTICLIGKDCSEFNKAGEQKWRKQELMASLYDAEGFPRSGLLGVVLPEVYDLIFKEEQICETCNDTHPSIHLYDDVVVRELSYNYFLPFPNQPNCWKDEDRFCILVSMKDFLEYPDDYIELAYQKTQEKVSRKVRWQVY